MGIEYIRKRLGKPLVYATAAAVLFSEPVFHEGLSEHHYEKGGYIETRKLNQEISNYIFTLPHEAQNKIEKYVERLASSKDMDIQTRWKNMSDHVEKYEKIADEYGIPRKIFLAVPLIENEGKEKGTSSKGAKGRWQIMPGTARSMGWKPADILDPLKAPYIAAQYLKDLYDYFGSWELALAGYNMGQTKIKTRGVKDYWRDVRKLPFETRETVPRVLAAAKILENPEQHNIRLENTESEFEYK